MSGTGQAQSRASLALNDKKVIATQSPGGGASIHRGGGGLVILCFPSSVFQVRLESFWVL